MLSKLLTYVCILCIIKTSFEKRLNISTAVKPEFKPMENEGYFIYEVGNLGGNDQGMKF